MLHNFVINRINDLLWAVLEFGGERQFRHFEFGGEREFCHFEFGGEREFHLQWTLL